MKIAVAVPCLCEFVWVLRKVYGFQLADLSAPVRALLATANVEMNRPAVEACLAMLEAGGDFADGAIAYEGQWLGAKTFVSFDKKAVALLTAQGQAARLLL
jgi:predicted nucleic-acid-binding protein